MDDFGTYVPYLVSSKYYVYAVKDPVSPWFSVCASLFWFFYVKHYSNYSSLVILLFKAVDGPGGIQIGSARLITVINYFCFRFSFGAFVNSLLL